MKSIQTNLIRLAISFLFLIVLHHNAGAQKKNGAEHIRQMDRHNASTLVNNDTAALMQYLAEDFLLNTSGNRVSFGGDQIISAMRSGRLRYLRFDVVTDTVYFINKKMAISMGSETAVSGSEGPLKGLIQERRYTNIWIKENKTWKLKARHSSIICKT